MTTKPIAPLSADPAATVRAARAAANMTQAEVAAATGIDRTRLSFIETGKVTDIRASESGALLRVLGVPLEVWVREADGEA